jgi:hypothetical protein
MVGVIRFERTTSPSRTVRASLTAPHPDVRYDYSYNFGYFLGVIA